MAQSGGDPQQLVGFVAVVTLTIALPPNPLRGSFRAGQAHSIRQMDATVENAAR